MQLKVFANEFITFFCMFLIIFISSYTYEIYRNETKFMTIHRHHSDNQEGNSHELFEIDYPCGIIPEYQLGILKNKKVDCKSFKWPWDVSILTSDNQKHKGFLLSRKIILASNYHKLKSANKVYHFENNEETEYNVKNVSKAEWFAIIELDKMINLNRFYMPICIQHLTGSLTDYKNLKTFSWNINEADKSLTNHPDRMFNCTVVKSNILDKKDLFEIKTSNLISNVKLCDESTGLFTYYRHKWTLVGILYGSKVFITVNENLAEIKQTLAKLNVF
ncbi:unnamed protein product [Brachionus calyciflorus]|uniref:Uncharacterized protein n=1 Tax=Brachionus calyciflorus TaxID=104777 RepID=A0A813YYT9_9BILA|nr:unnamed protein product [Brachionus calyciflorus]